MRPSPKALLKKAGLPAFLSVEPVHMRYLTGARISHGALLIDGSGYRLYVSDLYIEAASKEVYGNVSVYPFACLKDALARKGVCGYEPDRITVSQLSRLKKTYKHISWKKTDGSIEWFRRVKSTEEVSLLKKADRITQILLDAVPLLLKEGITEQELAWELESVARANGAEGLSFPPIVAFGTHTSRPHHIPTNRRLKRGQVVQIDIGALYKGYCGDRSAVYFTDAPTDRQQKVLKILEQAQKKAIKAICAGVKAADIEAIARNYLKKHGLDEYFTHSLGHGIGLEIHEGVTLSQKSDNILLAGEVVTVEPGVYFPGKWGMRVEKVVVVQ